MNHDSFYLLTKYYTDCPTSEKYISYRSCVESKFISESFTGRASGEIPRPSDWSKKVFEVLFFFRCWNVEKMHSITSSMKYIQISIATRDRDAPSEEMERREREVAIVGTKKWKKEKKKKTLGQQHAGRPAMINRSPLLHNRLVISHEYIRLHTSPYIFFLRSHTLDFPRGNRRDSRAFQ